MNGFSICAFFLQALLALESTQESYLGAHTQAPAFSDDGAADPDLAQGLAVTVVVENSPAAAAGLQVGDRVLRLNGEAPRTPQHLEALVAALPVGAHLRIAARRGLELLDLEALTVARLEPRRAPDVRQFVEGAKLGLALTTLTSEESRLAGAGPGDGARVRRPLEGSPAAGKLLPGDVLLAVGEKTVHGAEDFASILRDVEPGSDVKLRLFRSGTLLETTVRARVPEGYVSKFHFPLVVIYESDPKKDSTTFGLILNLFKYTRQENRRTYRFLYIISFSTGTNEVLEEVNE